MQPSTKALVETLKSVARGVYFALLGVVALVLTILATSPELAAETVYIYGVPVNIGAMIVALAASAAKIVDRYIHKNDGTTKKGIAPTFLQR